MNKKLLSVIALVAAILALLVLRHVELARQTELVTSLLTVATIVFAILGVWVSVLNPVAILDRKFPEPTSDSSRLAIKFAPLLRQATFLLALAILMRFCLPLVPPLSSPLVQGLIQGIMGFMVTFLYIWQVGILLGTLLPLEHSTRAIRTMDTRRRSRRDKGRQSERAEDRVGVGKSLE